MNYYNKLPLNLYKGSSIGSLNEWHTAKSRTGANLRTVSRIGKSMPYAMACTGATGRRKKMRAFQGKFARSFSNIKK